MGLRMASIVGYSPTFGEEEFSEVEHVQGQQEGPELLGPDPPGSVAFCYLATAPARVSSRPLSVPGKEAGQGSRNLLWSVLLDEVPALLDELELRARDLLPQSRS